MSSSALTSVREKNKSCFRSEVRCSICCSVLDEENRDSVLNIFKSLEDNKLHSVITMLENIIGQ